MKKLLLLTLSWMLAFQINQTSMAQQQRTFTMQAPISSASGNYWMLKLTNHSPLPSECNEGQVALSGAALFLCVFIDGQSVWQPMGGIWSQDPDTKSIYLSDTDPEFGVALGTNQKEFKLTLDNDGGIIAKGEFGSGETLATTGSGARMIWYPRKGAFRAGVAGPSYPDALDDDRIGIYSFAAGHDNRAVSEGSTISGGTNNYSSGLNSAVSGGSNNIASADESAIGGGHQNQIGAIKGTIGGGNNNIVNGNLGTIGGGASNFITGPNATIAGGSQNQASGINSSIGGGSSNQATHDNTTVAGGAQNRAINLHATVGGGFGNTASDLWSVVAGGHGNQATGFLSSILGGSTNLASGNNSTVLGGNGNEATGVLSVAIGQDVNAIGDRAIGFGSSLNVHGNDSFVFSNNFMMAPLSVPYSDTFTVLSNKVALGDKFNLLNTLPAKLNVWRNPDLEEDIAAYFVDIIQIKARNVAPLCAQPADLGKIYVNSTTNDIYFCNGTQWKSMTASGGAAQND